MIRTRRFLAMALLAACGDDGAASQGADDGDDASSSSSEGTTEAGSTVGESTSGAGSTSSSEESSSSESDASSSSESSSSSTGATPDTTPPVVEITSPRGGNSVRATLEVQGTVSDDVGVLELVYAGPAGDVAIDVAPDGSFAASLPIVPGPNAVTLHARDEAGNEGSATVDVHFGHRISVGNSQAALLREGTLYTWGRNELGQLGNGTLEGSAYGDTPPQSEWPVRYALDVEGIVSIVTRQTFMIALRDDGAVMTWGSNASGQLGYAAETDCGTNGTSPCRREPTAVPSVSGAIAVQAGFDHAMVLLANGTVMTWGSNALGQLGYATEGSSTNVPTVVDGPSNVVQLAAGSGASYALLADGTVLAWGENGQGQLGQGTSDNAAHPTPTAVPGLGDVEAIAAANTTAFALLADGTVLAWGRNHAGQAGIGDESGAIVLAPTQVMMDVGNGVEPLADVIAIAGDGFVGLALTHGGDVLAWGMGSLGQLGQGYLAEGGRDLANRYVASPVAVEPVDDELFDIAEIEVGAGGPALSLAHTGDLFGWGWSFRGSLGLEGAIDAWAYSAALLVFAAD